MLEESDKTTPELLAELDRLRKRNAELEELIRHDTAEHEITALALHESEVRHRTYVENAPHAIFVIDANRRFVDMNQAACTTTGYSRAELLDMYTSQVVERLGPTDSGPSFENPRQNGKLQAERRIRRKDGTGCAVLLNAVALPADRFMAFCTDITVRKRAEEELRESRRQYEMLFNEMPDAYALHEIICDENDVPVDYRFLEVNSAFEGQTGLSAANILGKTVREVMPDVESTWIQKYGKVALTGVPIEFESYSRPLERHYSSKAFCPKERLFAVLFNDITERRKTERALRSEKTQSEKYINSLPGLFYVFDRERFVRWNNRWTEVTGYTDEELAKMYGTDFFEGADKEKIGEKMAEVFQAGFAEVETDLVTKDGTHIPYHFMGVRTRLDNKLHLVGFGIDVTERKAAELERLALETEIRQAQKLDSLGILAGGIAHDFNNLLMGVLGNSELALAALPSESPARDDIENVRRAATRASELANQMLAYSGRGQFIIKSVNLSEVVREMGQLLEASVPKTTALEFQLAPDVPPIDADVTQIRQVVLNLIINASEALEEKSGVVTVTSGVRQCNRAYLDDHAVGADCKEGPYVYLEVSDQGRGMDPETASKIFDPFFTTKFTGRGLGLAAVFGIVRGHEGAIKVDSVPNEGTTVRVMFPETSKPAQSVRDSGEQTILPECGGRILLVDDEADVLEVGQRMLEAIGYEVSTAGDGEEAVQVFKRSSTDFICVLLDLTMPKMDGETAFEEFRKINADIPVVLTSGYSAGDVEARTASKGFAGFIKKPYRLAELKKALRAAILE